MQTIILELRMKYLLFIVVSVVAIAIGLLYAYDDDQISQELVEIVISSPEIIFHYEDEFSIVEKNKLEKWLIETVKGTERTLGKYPFDLHLFLHRASDSSEPVPWAHTDRSAIQEVHFHVDTKFSLEEFLKDWTAPHEISHLAIPFVGKSNSWFAEGFATYMQGEILLEMGQCTQLDIEKKYEQKINAAKPYYQSEEPFSKVAMELRKQHHYPQMYWGGAYFFFQLNEILESSDGRSLCEIMKVYESCCRMNDKNINDILKSIDEQVEGTPAQDLMLKYTTVAAKEIIE